MMPHQSALLFAGVPLLAILLVAGFAPGWSSAQLHRARTGQLLTLSVILALPYTLVSLSYKTMTPGWLAFYILLSPAVIGLLLWARHLDPAGRGTILDLLVLGFLGLAVDLRWLEAAWPQHLAVFNKVMLLDLGILGFLGARQLEGVGFDLRLRARDLRTALREFGLYAPIAIALGLWLGFLHPHGGWPHPAAVAEAGVFTFFFIAVPEELYFRGWMQNLLERRLGRGGSLAVTAALFGLSHFNKRAAHFNWRYLLLATLAGVFYGRAWRRDRRVAASALTHTLVDTVWSLTLR